ncbi:MAG: sorbitol dehydrogenase [Roseateles depolymerans]|uniref:Sorbitol dehydrogenase n=1 Tax=Roseateles depolymerans TaxID=76731 RepID=A0A2W5FNC0_9BURK|nr:MAG: sorbitol dehydrogenase [Roseateles depolymerans]
MAQTTSPWSAAERGLSRRTLIGGAAAAGVAALTGGGLLGMTTAFAAATSSEDFLRLSEFLTGGKPLDATLAGRYLAELGKDNEQFAAATAALQRHIADTKPAHVDDLLATELDAGLRQTAKQIVSAWYLGIVGDGAKARLVSYANALMYRPTEGVLVIPSYGGGPDSWGDKPATPAAATPKPAA